MSRYIRFVLRHPVLVLITGILITVGLAAGIGRLQLDTSLETFLPQSDPAFQRLLHRKLTALDWQGETIDAGKRVLPETPAEFASFKDALRRNPAFEKGIYATSATSSGAAGVL
ncbi:MAG: hypothetical protein R6X08_02370 [Desulfosalsimonadaceae bacterium]